MKYPEQRPHHIEHELHDNFDEFEELLREHYDGDTGPLLEPRMEDSPSMMGLLDQMHGLFMPKRIDDVESWTAAYQAYHFAIHTSQMAGMRIESFSVKPYLGPLMGNDPHKFRREILGDVAKFYEQNPATKQLTLDHLSHLTPESKYYREVILFAGLGYIFMSTSQPRLDLETLHDDIDKFEQGGAL